MLIFSASFAARMARQITPSGLTDADLDWEIYPFPSPEDVINDQKHNHPLPFTWHANAHNNRNTKDRTEWGYYREFAPPVLPVPALYAEFVEELEAELLRQRTLALSSWSTPNMGDITMSLSSRRQRGSANTDGSAESTGIAGSHAPWPFRTANLISLPSLVQPLTRSISSSTNPLSSHLVPSQSLANNQKIYFKNSHSNMAPKVHWWISAWFLITAPVILWDAMYCFFRPRSMTGGDLHWIWEPYGLYQNIDYMYGLKALEDNNGFTNAQSLLNLVETVMNLVYLYLVHFSKSPTAPLIGFAATVMTLSKTYLYWLQEYYCNWCNIGHNNLFDLALLWVLPNGLWIVFPTLIVWALGNDIRNTLRFSSKLVSGKTE